MNLKYFSALFCALLVLSILDPIKCKKFGSSRGGSHNYPSSHGLSGSSSRHTGGLSGGSHGYPSSSHRHPSSSGSHGYPSSGGLSGSGGSHGYPSSGGLSGGSRYPSTGGSHGYPPSGGHGYPSGGLSGGGNGYPTGSKPLYPSSGNGKPSYPSSGHSYPSSGGGLSGSGSSKPRYPTHTTHTTVHHHYNYNPPSRIMYAPPGQMQRSYPVYHGPPPSYVYKYKDSGSKYGTLLAGLALLNLGTLAGSVYANRHSQRTYKPQPGEVCMFAVKKISGAYEETKIDCELITSFIWAEEDKLAKANNGTINSTNSTNSTIVSTVTNVTVVNTTNTNPAPATMPPPPVTSPPNVLYQMLPNGTLVPVNVTQPNAGLPNATLPNATLANVTNPVPANGTTTSMTVTTTTTNTTVVNALDVKGKDVLVTPGMQCFVMRTTPTSKMRKPVRCGLLQSYARQSLKPNSAIRNIPTFTLLFAVAAFVLY